jgi:hypothetical protein
LYDTGEAPWSLQGEGRANAGSHAAILSADVARYSRMIEADEEGTKKRAEAHAGAVLG